MMAAMSISRLTRRCLLKTALAAAPPNEYAYGFVIRT